MAIVPYRIVGKNAPKDPVPVDKDREGEFLHETIARGYKAVPVVPYDLEFPTDPMTGKTPSKKRVFIQSDKTKEFEEESKARSVAAKQILEGFSTPAQIQPREITTLRALNDTSRYVPRQPVNQRYMQAAAQASAQQSPAQEPPATPEGSEIRNRISFRQAMNANREARLARDEDVRRTLTAVTARGYGQLANMAAGVMDDASILTGNVPLGNALSKTEMFRNARQKLSSEAELASQIAGEADAETLRQGGVAAAAAQRIGSEAAILAPRLALIRGVTGRGMGESVGRGADWVKGAKDTIKQAAGMAGFVHATTPGTMAEKNKAAGLTFAYMATPAFSSLATSDAAAIIADIGLNTGISMASGAWDEAVVEAKAMAEQRGEPDAWKKYLAVTLSPSVLSDVAFSLGTRAANGDSKARAAIQQIEQRAGRVAATSDVQGKAQSVQSAGEQQIAKADTLPPIKAGTPEGNARLEQIAAEQARIDAENARAEAEMAAQEDAPPMPKQLLSVPPTQQKTVGSTEPKQVEAGPAISAQPEAVIGRDTKAVPAGKAVSRPTTAQAAEGVKPQIETGTATSSKIVKHPADPVLDEADAFLAEGKWMGAKSRLATARFDMAMSGDAAEDARVAERMDAIEKRIRVLRDAEDASQQTPTASKPPELMMPEEQERAAKQELPDWALRRVQGLWTGSAQLNEANKTKLNDALKAYPAAVESLLDAQGRMEFSPDDLAQIRKWHREAVRQIANVHGSIPAQSVDRYEGAVNLPPGYVRDGDRYVFKGEQAQAPRSEQAQAPRSEQAPPVANMGREIGGAVGASIKQQRDRVSNVRYGKPGEILFEYDGKTYTAKEPSDVMPAVDNKGTNADASRSWALRQILDGTATPTPRGIDLAKLSPQDAARVAELQRAFQKSVPARQEDEAMRAFDSALGTVDATGDVKAAIESLPRVAGGYMKKRAGRMAAQDARTESVQAGEAVGRQVEDVSRLPDEQAALEDAARVVEEARQALPEAQRNALQAELDGDIAGYAKRNGIPLSTARKRAATAKVKLAAVAKQNGIDAGVLTKTQKGVPSEVVRRLDELADEALKRIEKRRSEGRVMMGVDPADARDYAIYGAAKIMKGVVRFAEWAKEMKAKFGAGIEPRLKAIYDESKRIAGITSKAKSRAEIDAQAAAMFPGKVIGRTAERAAESAKIPKFEEGVKAKAAAWHKPMNLDEVKTSIDSMTPEQLVAESNKPVGNVSEDATQNVRLAAWGKRYQNAMDDFRAETDPARIEQKRAVLEDLAAEFSRASGGVGQAMRVMREFYETNPAGRIMLMGRALSKQGLRMSDATLKNMTGHIEKMDAVEERIAKAERALIDNPDNADAYKELEAAEQSLKDVIRNMNQTVHETMEPNLARMMVASLQGGYIRIPTLLNNYLYNVFATPIFSLEHYLSAGIDRVRSAVGRPQRLIRTPMARGRIRALKDAASESWEVMRRGYGTSNVPGPAGERTSNMKPFVALRQLIDFARGRPSTLPVDKKTGKVTPKTLALKGAETVLGSIHALKLRALAPGDVLFRTRRKEAALFEYYWNQGLRGSKLDAAVRTPDPVALRRADIDSAERVFQEDSAVAQAINKYFFGGVERFGKSVGGAVGEAAAAVGVRATTTPFVKTLINVNRFFVELGLPPVPAAEAIYFATRAGQAHRKADAASDGPMKKQLRAQAEDYTIAAEKKMARAIVGLGVFGITSAISDMGVLAGTPPSNEAERKIGYARGGWMRMNISAMKRILNGQGAEWMPGDYTVDLQKVGPLGQVLIAHADAKRSIDKMRKKMTIGEPQEGGAALYTKALLSNMVAASLNSSMAKDINMALDTLKSADQKKMSTWFGQRFANTLAIFLPNDLIAAGQVKDPVLRDPTGEGFGENVKRGVNVRTFNTEDVPEQLDMFGRTIPSTGDKDDDVMDRIVDRFFNPLGVREIKPDAETDFVNKVADAAGDDRRAYPPRVPRTIKVDGNEYALSEPMWLERQKAVGAERVKAVQSVMQYASGEMSEQKAKTIAKTLDVQYERARERADAQFVARLKQEYPDALRNTKP